jgi:hypothetical protein
MGRDYAEPLRAALTATDPAAVWVDIEAFSPEYRLHVTEILTSLHINTTQTRSSETAIITSPGRRWLQAAYTCILIGDGRVTVEGPLGVVT